MLTQIEEQKISPLPNTTSTVLMVRPKNFGYNPETAQSNAFQNNAGDRSPSEIKILAISEFDEFVRRLRSVGIEVWVAPDSEDPIKTDAIFPNNWVTFHRNGTVILYPMLALNRRLERQDSILQLIDNEFIIHQKIDFSPYEKEEKFLEGTGSMILDRQHRLVYACISPRTDAQLLEQFCQSVGYRKVEFNAFDRNGQAIYHTNVMMAMGETFVVICLDSVADENERKMLVELFEQTGKEVIDLTFDQMEHFAGNMLQLKNTSEKSYLIMSEQAFLSLRPDQIEQIERHTEILHSPLYTIEKYGGGSARCMIAEIFLPKKS